MSGAYRELRDYQFEGIDFLVENPRAGLFIDMGMGKTAIILHALLELPGPSLLIGPIRVIESVWRQEAQVWPGTRNLTFSLLRGSPAERKKAREAEADVYLVNPELLPDALLRKYRNLIIDESTMFKNPSTTRFRTLRKALPKFERRIIATGTPVPNSLMDLWSQVYILDQGERLSRAFGHYQSRYFHPVDYQGYKFEANPGAKEAITEKVSDIVYRLRSAPGARPKAIENVIPIPLSPTLSTMYKTLEEQAFLQLENSDTLTAATAATTMMKLRQFTGGFVYNDEEGVSEVHRLKIEATREILEGTGSPVILVYQFRHELQALKAAFPEAVEYSPSIQDQWDRGEIPLMFLHPQSGGHGLNLQYGGHVMILYSLSFSLEQMTQVMGRIDRQGQVNAPVFHFLICPETVDELMKGVLEERAANQTSVLQMIQEYAREKMHRR